MKRENGVCFLLCLFPVITLTVSADPCRGEWLQWGGPDRNCTVQAEGLADSWPEDGPRKLWHRPLGVGYSAILYDGGMLFTMYRPTIETEEECTIALDANSGATIWELRNPAKLPEPPFPEWGGFGPNATPLIVGDRLYTIGSLALMRCLDKKSGRILWEHHLVDDFSGPAFENDAGYCPSPIVYKDMILVPGDRRWFDPVPGTPEEQKNDRAKRVSQEGRTFLAFDQLTGKLVWKSQHFKPGYSSPVVITVAGQDQLVFPVAEGVVGIDPANGALLWLYPVEQGEASIMTPMWINDDTLFYSWNDNGVGSRAFRIVKRGEKFDTEELWRNKNSRFIQANPVRIGDHLYGTSGHPAMVIGIDARTGKRLWVERGFNQAAFLHADGKIIFLDWDGKLALATATPERLTIHSQFQIAGPWSMTVPTLVGKTLYLRDRSHIMALDLG